MRFRTQCSSRIGIEYLEMPPGWMSSRFVTLHNFKSLKEYRLLTIHYADVGYPHCILHRQTGFLRRPMILVPKEMLVPHQ